MLPIVLHHGIFGYDRMRFGPWKWCYFGGGIDQEIASRGHPLIVARVSRTGPIAERAAQLKQTVLDQLELMGRSSDRVIILAHSMGGLDARYMIHRLGMASRVAALVTLSTPHRGSSYADYILRNIDKSRRAQQLLRFLGLDLSGIRDLTRPSMQRFNEQIPDHPDVTYFSISASRPWYRVPAFLVHSHHIVSRDEGPNDGVVSVASAQWGNHLETWPADHMHVVNRRLVLEIRNRTGNVRSRYARLLDELESRGLLNPSSSETIV